MNLKKNKIGILGGSFDPVHKGHLAISKEANRRFKLSKVIWAITKKNPFKKKSNNKLSIRIKNCKKYFTLNEYSMLVYDNENKVQLAKRTGVFADTAMDCWNNHNKVFSINNFKLNIKSMLIDIFKEIKSCVKK